METLRSSKLGLAVVMCLIANTAFGAFTYSFVNITNNDAYSAAVGEAQLSMTVSDYGSNQVLFTFNNSGPVESFIGQIYFENPLDLLDGITELIQNTDEVNFIVSPPPPPPYVLPGGNTIAFIAAYKTQADSPGSNKDGVDPGEELGIVFDIDAIGSFDDVIADLDSGLLRVGIHFQGIDPDGYSEAYVNNGRVPPVVPVPAALPLALLGAGWLGFFRKSGKIE